MKIIQRDAQELAREAAHRGGGRAAHQGVGAVGLDDQPAVVRHSSTGIAALEGPVELPALAGIDGRGLEPERASLVGPTGGDAHAVGHGGVAGVGGPVGVALRLPVGALPAGGRLVKSVGQRVGGDVQRQRGHAAGHRASQIGDHHRVIARIGRRGDYGQVAARLARQSCAAQIPLVSQGNAGGCHGESGRFRACSQHVGIGGGRARHGGINGISRTQHRLADGLGGDARGVDHRLVERVGDGTVEIGAVPAIDCGEGVVTTAQGRRGEGSRAPAQIVGAERRRAVHEGHRAIGRRSDGGGEGHAFSNNGRVRTGGQRRGGGGRGCDQRMGDQMRRLPAGRVEPAAHIEIGAGQQQTFSIVAYPRAEGRPATAIPFRYVAGAIRARRGESPGHVEICSGQRQAKDGVVQPRAEGRPGTAIPFRDIVGGGLADIAHAGKTPAGVEVARAVQDHRMDPSEGAATRVQGRPGTAIPFGNGPGFHPAHSRELPARVEIPRAVQHQSPDVVAHPRTEGRPGTAIPLGDVFRVGYPARRGEPTARVERAAAGPRQRIDVAIHPRAEG